MFTLPAEYTQVIAETIRGFGEAVVYKEQHIVASVQRPIAGEFFNDAQQDDFVVYVTHNDLVIPPKQFDKITIRGVLRTVVEAEEIRASNLLICYVLLVRG